MRHWKFVWYDGINRRNGLRLRTLHRCGYTRDLQRKNCPCTSSREISSGRSARIRRCVILRLSFRKVYIISFDFMRIVWWRLSYSIRVFHKRKTLASLALLPTLYSHIFTISFFICNHMMVVNVKFDISGFKRVMFKGYRLHSCFFYFWWESSWIHLIRWV